LLSASNRHATVIQQVQTHTAVSIKVVPEQSGKVEYEGERMLGIANKFINVLAIPSSLSRSYSAFPLYSWTTLIEIAVYNSKEVGKWRKSF
jgi:hypothetical protein